MAVDFGTVLLQINQSHIFNASTCCLPPPALPTSVCFSSHLPLQWISSSYLFLPGETLSDPIFSSFRAGGAELRLHVVCGLRRETLPLIAFCFHFLTPPSPPPPSSFTLVNHFLPSTFSLSLMSSLPFLYHLFPIRCMAWT